jgi:lysophospholipase-3
VYSDYFARVKNLVQHASEKNGNKSVILVGHSYGGMVTQDFLNSTTILWRKNFIKHVVLISPTPPTGFMQTVTNLASGPTVIVLPETLPIALRPMWRTFASSLLSLPSPWVFGDKPLIITKHKNYTANEYLNFLATLGFSNDGVVPFTKRVLPKMMRVDAPMVPTTYLNGIGVSTPEQAIYPEGNFDVTPEYVHGDGDGCINLVSVLAFAEELRRQHMESNTYFNFVKIEHATHSGIVIWDHSLKIVIAEILKANM